MADEQFMVHPEALKGYAGLLQRNNGYVEKMRTYLEGPGSQFDGLKYLMADLRERIEHLNKWQYDTLTEIDSKLADTTVGLQATADTYASMDQTAAANMDSTVPTAPA